jgi:hypothetical protein
MENPVKQCYEWQKCKMGVKSWATELKEEIHTIRLALVGRKQQECNLREMLRLVKERCNDIKILATFPDKKLINTIQRTELFLG